MQTPPMASPIAMCWMGTSMSWSRLLLASAKWKDCLRWKHSIEVGMYSRFVNRPITSCEAEGCVI